MKPKKIEENNGHYHQIQEFFYKGMKISKIKYKDLYHGNKWTALFEYDTIGKLSKVRYPNEEYTFIYDGTGRLIQEKLTYRASKNSLFNQNLLEIETETEMFEYDSNNLIVKRVSKHGGYGREREYIFTYTYDSKQRVSKIENLTDKLTFTYDYLETNNPLANIQLPNCFLVDYKPFKILPSKITPTQGSIYTNTILSENSEKFPTEIERKDYNGFKMNIKITY